MSLGPKANGSLALTVMVSVAALGMGMFYAMNKSKETGLAVDEYRLNRARESTQNTGVSNLATIRGLFADTKVNGSYQPAVFPSNYFDAQKWDLQKNAAINLPAITLKSNQIEIRTFPLGESSFAKTNAVFANGKSQAELLESVQLHKIVALNPDPAHPFYIRSIDVSMDREIGGKSKRRLETVGRIMLSAPLPSNLKVRVKLEGSEGDFSEILGSFEKPLPPGRYRIQLLGSGVVHFGEVTLGAKTYQVGINKGEITHKANNALVKDVVIGEFTEDLKGPVREDKEVTVDKDVDKGGPEQCTIGAAGIGRPADEKPVGGTIETTTKTTTTTTTSEPGGFDLTAKLYAVDGTVADEVKATIFVGGGGGSSSSSSTTTVAKSSGGNLACQNACPMEYNKDFNGSLSSMATALDRGVNREADTRKIDFFDPKKTAGTIAPGAKGIVCANHDLIGQVIAVRNGKKPSAILREDPAQFEKLLADNAQFKRFYAYLAPSCVRTLINDRDGCGCFAADTKIMMGDRTERAASEIRVGDLVWNPKLERPQAVKRVVRGPELVPMFSLTIDGSKLLVTGGHPFLTQRGLQPAHKLAAGDRIMDGASVSVVEAVEVQPADKANPPVVWNFELEGGSSPSEHYVLANGVMTGDLYLQESLAGSKDAVARYDQ